MRRAILLSLTYLSLVGCVAATRGPDKQFEEGTKGAAMGAVSGAVTGFQVASATGPGAVIGAGIGFAAGSLRGAGHDQLEEELLDLQDVRESAAEQAFVQEVLTDQIARRIELHPGREIYPADIFFISDSAKMKRSGYAIIKELARRYKEKAPTSRLAITSYIRASDKSSSFARHITEKRARAIVTAFVRAGVEQRRMVAKAVIMQKTLLFDPDDAPDRYNQAIEIIKLDN